MPMMTMMSSMPSTTTAATTSTMAGSSSSPPPSLQSSSISSSSSTFTSQSPTTMTSSCTNKTLRQQQKPVMATHQHRILIYTTCYNVLDGVTLTIRKIEQEILAQGHCVCILSTRSGNINNTHMDGEHPNRTVLFLDNSVPIPFLHDPNHPDESYHLGFSLSSSIRQQIEAFEPTLLHITVPDCTCLHLIQYARTKELPLMGTYHSNIPEYMDHYPRMGWLKHILHAFFRHQYNFLQALYVPTPFIKRHLTDSVQMHHVTKLGVWGRGIDLDRFSPVHRSDDFRTRYGFGPNDVVILWCGRLVPEKRPDIYAYVVKRLAAEGIPFKGLIVGAGPCEDEVKSLPNTTFAGWMSGDDLAIAYASSDVFLFPSAVETFGNVTLEAAASGLPLVVEEGCSGHLVNHGVNGFACQDGDLDGYYNSTLCLVLDNLRRMSMSEEGRKFSLQFEKREVCKRMIDNYFNVTDEFYSDYGGRHANRDVAYTKDKSFLGGNYPRPVALIAVEYLFILIFRVMYQMATIFFHVQERLLSSTNRSTDPSKSLSRKGVKSQSKSSPSRKASPRQSETTGTVASHIPPSQCMGLNRIEEVDERSNDSSLDYGSQSQHQQQHSLMKALDEERDEEHDDETNSTTTVTDSVSIASGDSSSNNNHNPVFSCQRQSSTDDRLPISHIIAIGFVQCLMFQTRMENRFRNSIWYMTSPSKWKNAMKRKRKNSNVYMKDDDDIVAPSSSSSTIDLQRSNTGSDLSGEDIELVVNISSNNNSRDDRLNMRRPMSVSAV